MNLLEFFRSKRFVGSAYCTVAMFLIVGLLAAPSVPDEKGWHLYHMILVWPLFVILVGLTIWHFSQIMGAGDAERRGRWGPGSFTFFTITFILLAGLLDLSLLFGVLLETFQVEYSPYIKLFDIVGASFALALILIFYAVRIKVVLDEKIEARKHERNEFEQKRASLSDEDARKRDNALKTEEEASRGWEFGHLICLEIGIALLVACFMSLTYELFLRKFAEERAEVQHARHVKESEKSVFKALFGHGVDEKVLKRFYNAIAASKFTRKACKLSFEFQPLDEVEKRRAAKHAADLVAVIVTVAYEIHNNTDEPAVYPPTSETSMVASEDIWRPYFENPIQFEEELDCYVGYSIKGCGQRKGCVPERAWDSKENVVTEYVRNENGQKGVKRRLNVGRILVMPKVPTEIRYSYKLFKKSSDMHAWVSSAPLTGVDIAVCDHSAKGLRFHVETIGEGDASRHDSSEAHHEWHDELGMLPNQGFMLYWSEPLPDKAQAAQLPKQPRPRS